MTCFDFDELTGGEEFDFYGVDEQRIRLDDITYQVIDSDSEDDYYVAIATQPIDGLPIARVVVEDDCSGIYELVDLHDGHCWLRFGLEVRDTSERSYETKFVFEYFPKGPGD